MSKKKFLGVFDKRPLIWFHYILLVGVLYLWYYLGDLIFKSNFTKLYIMLPTLFVFLSIGDQLIHKILKVD